MMWHFLGYSSSFKQGIRGSGIWGSGIGGFGVLGFRGLGILGFRGLGFKCLRLRTQVCVLFGELSVPEMKAR